MKVFQSFRGDKGQRKGEEEEEEEKEEKRAYPTVWPFSSLGKKKSGEKW